MTSRTKRRLVVLALALGLIAVAPYLFESVADGLGGARFGRPPWWRVEVQSDTFNTLVARGILLTVGPIHVEFGSYGPYTNFAWEAWLNGPIIGNVDLPREHITLRVACAGALAGVWLLVVCARLLARRWTQKNPSSVAV